MGRPRKPVPSYLRHKASGRAYVRVGTDNVYLGAWESPESKSAYRRVCADIEAGRDPRPAAPGPLTVAEMLDKFRDHALEYYRHPDGTPTSEVACIKEAVRPLRALYGELPAAEFGPLALKAVRQKMVEDGASRTTANARTNRVRRAFKWAASEELIPGGVCEALRTVAALKKGRTTARETAPVMPVDDARVEATLPYLPPTVADMVRVQRLSGMRPGEARWMTPGEVDRSGPVWVYSPGRHKTAYRGRRRDIPLGPKAQAVLAPYLAGKDADAPVFSPAAAKAESAAVLRARRKSKVQPSQVSRAKPPALLKRKTPAMFTIRGYCDRVETACKRAGVAHWHPNQLRHAYATAVRRQYGLEAAQVGLGHSRADVTQVYASRDLKLAEKVAIEIG